MGLLRSDDSGDSDSTQDTSFQPITTDGNRVLGYLDDPDSDGLEAVWVSGNQFRQLSKSESKQIDRVVR